jgi:hypothetical protein
MAMKTKKEEEKQTNMPISVTQKYQNFDFLGGIVEILFL